MTLYHRTSRESAKQIQADGFRDGVGNYLTENSHSGVWLSNVPLDENEGASGDVLLEITVSLTEADVSKYEWAEEGKGYREFLIPAELLNPSMQMRIVEDRADQNPLC
jgi:hypothetical protein